MKASHASLNQLVQSVSTENVMNPLLWALGAVLFFCVPAASLTDGYKSYIFMAIIFLVIAATFIAYFIWMKKDPDRLQSETFQLEQQKILQSTKEEGDFLIENQTEDHPPRLTHSIADDSEDESLPSSPSRLVNNGGGNV